MLDELQAAIDARRKAASPVPVPSPVVIPSPGPSSGDKNDSFSNDDEDLANFYEKTRANGGKDKEKKPSKATAKKDDGKNSSSGNSASNNNSVNSSSSSSSSSGQMKVVESKKKKKNEKSSTDSSASTSSANSNNTPSTSSKGGQTPTGKTGQRFYFHFDGFEAYGNGNQSKCITIDRRESICHRRPHSSESQHLCAGIDRPEFFV